MIQKKAWRKPTLGNPHPPFRSLYRPPALGYLGDATGTTAGVNLDYTGGSEDQPLTPIVPLPPPIPGGYGNITTAGGDLLSQQQLSAPITSPAAPSSSVFTTLANDVTALAAPVVSALTAPYYNAQGQLVNPLTGNVTAGGIGGALAAIGPTGLLIGGVVLAGLLIASNKK